MTTRRDFLITGAAALSASMSGCGRPADRTRPDGAVQESAGGSRKSGEVLRVFVYAGAHEKTMQDVFVPRFKAATGVQATLYSGWWDAIAKLKTAPENDPPFDLMITDATQGYPAAREGLFASINFKNIPNHRGMDPSALDCWVYRDAVGLPYPDAVMTLAYNRKLVETPPARWADLLQPALKGRISLYSSFYMSLYTFAAILASQRDQAGTAQQIVRNETDELFRFATEQRGAIQHWWPTTSEMILSLVDRRVAAGNMHSPEYLQALREKPELGASVPVQDRAMVQVFWAIPAGTPRQSLAEQALDLMFGEELQLEFAKRGMATARLDVAMKMAIADSLWKEIYPHTAEQLKALQYYPYDFYAEHWDELADRWDRTVLRGA